jgi:hypothetical protein
MAGNPAEPGRKRHQRRTRGRALPQHQHDLLEHIIDAIDLGETRREVTAHVRGIATIECGKGMLILYGDAGEEFPFVV